ncbi:hypothetical protein [Methylobacterium sp. WL6]|uniref:hypothetical protein n=1 Tax=Methylobacterium sp. WL6 TaxID=2603901 RepID=UPI00164F4E2E|nr:hypothetical protein [Methylobacterium sp. WL6]
MHHVTKERTADGHFMVKVAGRAVTEACEKRQAKRLVRTIRGLRRLKKAKKQASARHGY